MRGLVVLLSSFISQQTLIMVTAAGATLNGECDHVLKIWDTNLIAYSQKLKIIPSFAIRLRAHNKLTVTPTNLVTSTISTATTNTLPV